MNEPAIVIRLDGDGRFYHPGDTLSGEYRLQSVTPEEVQATEVSVLWHTEGKGDEDLAVHEFWRSEAAGSHWIDPRRPARFSTTLPRSPLSYEGQIVKIRWCVRVRAFLARGKEVVGQRVFRLGCVPSAKGERSGDSAARPSVKQPALAGDEGDSLSKTCPAMPPRGDAGVTPGGSAVPLENSDPSTWPTKTSPTRANY